MAALSSETRTCAVVPNTTNSKRFFLQRALTNKARCRHCRRPIALNEWRFGQSISRRANSPEPFKAWFHIDCVSHAFSNAGRYSRFVRDPVTDVDEWAFVDETVRVRFREQMDKLASKHVQQQQQQQQTQLSLSSSTHRRLRRRHGHAADRQRHDLRHRRRHRTIDARADVDSDDSFGCPRCRRDSEEEKHRDDDSYFTEDSYDDEDTTTTTTTPAKTRRCPRCLRSLPLATTDSCSSLVDQESKHIRREMLDNCLLTFRRITDRDGADDSLEAFTRVRQCLAAAKDANDCTEILRLWFSCGRSLTGFRGDLRLWFVVLVSMSMKRSFCIKNKQLIKFFTTRVLHVPLGTIEDRVLSSAFVRQELFSGDSSRFRLPKVSTVLASSSSEDLPTMPPLPPIPLDKPLSRSTERRINNRYLPSLLTDMIRESSNPGIRIAEQSVLGLAEVWNSMELIGSYNIEAKRNLVLHDLLNRCTHEDVETVLRILLSETGFQMSLRQLISVFDEHAFNAWTKHTRSATNRFRPEHIDFFLSTIDLDYVRRHDYLKNFASRSLVDRLINDSEPKYTASPSTSTSQQLVVPEYEWSNSFDHCRQCRLSSETTSAPVTTKPSLEDDRQDTCSSSPPIEDSNYGSTIPVAMRALDILKDDDSTTPASTRGDSSSDLCSLIVPQPTTSTPTVVTSTSTIPHVKKLFRKRHLLDNVDDYSEHVPSTSLDDEFKRPFIPLVKRRPSFVDPVDGTR